MGTGKDLSIRELAETMSTATGCQGAIEWKSSKPDGTPKKQLDVSRLASTVALFRKELAQQLVRP